MTIADIIDDDSAQPSALIPRDTVDEIVARRDAALAEYTAYFDALEAAKPSLERGLKLLYEEGSRGASARPSINGRESEIERFVTACALPDTDELKDVARDIVDRKFWERIIEMTDLKLLMDATALKELSDQATAIEGLPEVTVDNVVSTLERFRDDAAMIWRRGMATAFSALDTRFRSHDGFKIGSRSGKSGRMIMTVACGDYGLKRDRAVTFRDIERAFLILDGRKPGSIISIADVIEEERPHRPVSTKHENELFRVNIFMNGNAHIYFKRHDLLEKVNRTLAEYYGAGLGWGVGYEGVDLNAQMGRALQRAPARNFGMFASPKKVSKSVIDRMDVYASEDDKGLALEPNAGTGSLSIPLAHMGYEVDVVEIQPDLESKLRRSRLYRRCHCCDFLAMTPRPIYSHIPMNPPFDMGRDIDHVLHALQFLKTGGRLVSVMSASTQYSSTKKAQNFRELIDGRKGKFINLPPASFAPATYVNTCILVIDRSKRW